jgi:hypothetical protein
VPLAVGEDAAVAVVGGRVQMEPAERVGDAEFGLRDLIGRGTLVDDVVVPARGEVAW